MKSENIIVSNTHYFLVMKLICRQEIFIKLFNNSALKIDFKFNTKKRS